MAGRGDPEFDYIVVGAGSSGSVIANRLSAEHGGTVLLLEAGGEARDIRYRIPAAARQLWFNPRSTWMYRSASEPGLHGRQMLVTRGKVLGGCSAVNGAVYNRGSHHDYEAWAAQGLPGWSYQSVVPYFLRLENHWAASETGLGSSGPVPVNALQVRSPLTERALAAAQEMGFPLARREVGAEPEGWGLPELNVDKRGRRITSADAFLTPARSRSTLTVQTGAQLARVVLEGTRAVGVEYIKDGQLQVARAAREVVLSAGAIGSPQALLLSGVGPAEELRKLGIAPRLDLPGVGRNFNDQPAAFVQFKSKLPLTFERNLRFDRLAVAAMRWGLGLSSALSGPPVIASANLLTDQSRKSPDLRLMLTGATTESHPWFPGIAKGNGHVIAGMFALSHPRSRGRVTLTSRDPLDHPDILYNILTDPGDIVEIRRAYRLMRELLAQPALEDVVGDFILPADEPRTDAEVDAFVRSVTRTTAHPMGSCRMGVDADAVVDEACRVHGIEHLRVVDMSVLPVQIAGNPHGPAMMLADRASDLILGQEPLTPQQAQAA
jgi:choline dehydrogenase